MGKIKFAKSPAPRNLQHFDSHSTTLATLDSGRQKSPSKPIEIAEAVFTRAFNRKIFINRLIEQGVD